MKLPKFSLRELFLLITLVAMALGWLLSAERYRVAYIGELSKAMRARHREEQLRIAIQGEDFGSKWDENANTYKVAKFEDLKREDRVNWVLGGPQPKLK